MQLSALYRQYTTYAWIPPDHVNRMLVPHICMGLLPASTVMTLGCVWVVSVFSRGALVHPTRFTQPEKR